jgi:hypothetical protein
LNISDMPKLSGMVQRAEDRIKGYLEDGRNEDAEKEKRWLMKYRNLESLGKEIEQLKSAYLEPQSSSQADSNTTNEAVDTSVEVESIQQKNEHHSDAAKIEALHVESNASTGLTKPDILSNAASWNGQVVPASDDDVNSDLSQEFAEGKVRMRLQDVHEVLNDLPDCAERSIMELSVSIQRAAVCFADAS